MLDLDDQGIYDDTCFNCQTVCDGTSGSDLDNCLAACVECQGYSFCFECLEGRFEGMLLALHDWSMIDCQDLPTLRRN